MKRAILTSVLILGLAGPAWAGHGDILGGAVYAVQLASVRSQEAAEGEWARLQKSHPDLLGDMELTVRSADLGDRGTFYRIQTGPFPNQATAEDMCWQLRAEKLDCLVLRRK